MFRFREDIQPEKGWSFDILWRDEKSKSEGVFVVMCCFVLQ